MEGRAAYAIDWTMVRAEHKLDRRLEVLLTYSVCSVTISSIMQFGKGSKDHKYLQLILPNTHL